MYNIMEGCAIRHYPETKQVRSLRWHRFRESRMLAHSICPPHSIAHLLCSPLTCHHVWIIGVCCDCCRLELGGVLLALTCYQGPCF